MSDAELQMQLAYRMLVVAFLTAVFPSLLFSRIPIAEGTEDLRELGHGASFVFHAHVTSFDTTHDEYGDEKGFANLHVDRWYKGKAESQTIRIKYAYDSNVFIQGHDCINLHRSDSWLIFANKNKAGWFEFSHDCEGGLPMSALLAEESRGDWTAKLQQDLIAGFRDPDQALRLANIARLGGLKMLSSADSLRPFVMTGTEVERKWSVYAAFRSGDMSVMDEAAKILLSIAGPRSVTAPKDRKQIHEPRKDAAPDMDYGDYPEPDIEIAFEFRYLRNPEAVPMLMKVLQESNVPVIRSCAMQGLEEIKDPRSLSVVAAHLDDSDSGVRYNALVTLMNITKSTACTLPTGWTEADIPRIEARCRTWWNETGSSTNWPAVSVSDAR